MRGNSSLVGLGSTSFGGLGNSSFASLTPAPASADEADPWVRGELIRSLMRASRGSYLLAAALMPAMVALSWGHVPHWQLFTWLAIGLVRHGLPGLGRVASTGGTMPTGIRRPSSTSSSATATSGAPAPSPGACRS